MNAVSTQIMWLPIAFGLMACIGIAASWCCRRRELPLPLSEGPVLALILMSVIVSGLSIHATGIWLALTLSALGTYALIDAQTGYVFDVSLYPFALVAIVHASSVSGGETLGGLAVAAGMFGLPFLLTNGGGMGFGDVKLSLAIGSILGPSLAFAAFTLAFVSGAVFGFSRRKSGTLDGEIPFVPFVFIGTFLAGGYVIYALR